MQNQPMSAGGSDADVAAKVETCVAQAERSYASGNAESAREAARQALELERENPRALYVLARAAFDENRPRAAVDYLRRAIVTSPDTARYHLDLAICLRVLLEHEEAVTAMRRAFDLGVDDAFAWQTKGIMLSDLGRFAEAGSAFRGAIARNPALGSSWYGLALIKRFAVDDPDFSAMQRTLERDDLAERDRANLYFALGRAFEDITDFDRAFGHYRTGNEIKRGQSAFDARAEQNNVERIRKAFTPQVLATIGSRGDPSELPVFVVGMPRSGTTLVERILDSHPQVHGAGEINDLWHTVAGIGAYLPHKRSLPDDIAAVRPEAWHRLAEIYLDKLSQYAPTAARIVDKLPFNYTLLGIIRLMFPRSRIIHCRRDPLDTCVSCYTISFGGDRGFTNSLEDLGATYRAYRAVMRHWQAVLPGGMLEVRYESLVEDTEASARRMIDYLGLSWSDACLEFHSNERAVSTASRVQVRQPVYRSSIGRWRRFERHLGPLRAALGDVLGEANT